MSTCTISIKEKKVTKNGVLMLVLHANCCVNMETGSHLINQCEKNSLTKHSYKEIKMKSLLMAKPIMRVKCLPLEATKANFQS